MNVIGVFDLNLDLLMLESFAEEQDVPDLVWVLVGGCSIDSASRISVSWSRCCSREELPIFSTTRCAMTSTRSSPCRWGCGEAAM